MPKKVYNAVLKLKEMPPAFQQFEKEDDAAKLINELETMLAGDKEFITIKNAFGITYSRIRRELLSGFGYEEREVPTEDELNALRNEKVVNYAGQGIAAGYPMQCSPLSGHY